MAAEFGTIHRLPVLTKSVKRRNNGLALFGADDNMVLNAINGETAYLTVCFRV
jgi:hypothetical protein